MDSRLTLEAVEAMVAERRREAEKSLRKRPRAEDTRGRRRRGRAGTRR